MLEPLKSDTKLKQVLDMIDPKLTRIFIPWTLSHSKYLPSFIRLSKSFKQSKQKRLDLLENGLRVPPFLILSITSKCNLNCKGCYASANGTVFNEDLVSIKNLNNELSWEQWKSIIKEASKLGVFGFVIAGGEPFLFPRLIELCEEFKDRLFIILTNGTTLKKEDFKKLKRSRNIAVLVSIEGGKKITDARRGEGVYNEAMNTIKLLNKIGILMGISVTITRTNFRYWMKTENIDDLINKNVRIGAFIEYIPLTPTPLQKSLENNCNWNIKDDHALMLTQKERIEFRKKIQKFRREKSIYLIHSPGDEEYFGGCVSAGRGFAHITSTGDLTPCPISNIATHNLTKSSLRDGLKSQLFKEICENEHLLETNGMPCALFAHPKEVDELAESVGAYRTGNKVEK